MKSTVKRLFTKKPAITTFPSLGVITTQNANEGLVVLFCDAHHGTCVSKGKSAYEVGLYSTWNASEFDLYEHAIELSN